MALLSAQAGVSDLGPLNGVTAGAELAGKGLRLDYHVCVLASPCLMLAGLVSG